MKFLGTSLSDLVTSDLDQAFDTSTKFLWIFSRFFAFPFDVNLKSKRLTSTTSLWRLCYLHATLVTLVVKTVWALSTLLLSLTNDQFYNQVHLPVHITNSAGYIACTVWMYELLVQHRPFFVIQWNGLLKYRHLISKPNFKYYVLKQFPISACGGFFALLVYQVLDPTWVSQVRFGAYYLRESGNLKEDWMYWSATAGAVMFDAVAFMSAANIVVLTWCSHAFFFDIWIAAIDKVRRSYDVNSVKRGKTSDEERGAEDQRQWSKVTEIVLLLRIFNLTNATNIFFTKVLNMALVIITYSCLVVMKFEQWYVTAFVVYIAAVNLSCYPLLYSKAFSVTAQLEELKRHVLMTEARRCLQVRKQVTALSTRGVTVGSFRTFEQESVLLFFDFVVQQCIGVILAHG